MERTPHRSRFQVLALGAIRAYRLVVSPCLPAACRFVPTCSEYAGDAIEKHGAIRGSAKALARLSRCHPLGGSGIDLVE